MLCREIYCALADVADILEKRGPFRAAHLAQAQEKVGICGTDGVSGSFEILLQIALLSLMSTMHANGSLV